MNETKINPWVIQPPKQNVIIPIGSYEAQFENVSEQSLSDGSIKWRWSWRITSGAFTGKEATALTEQTINANTHAGRLVAGLLGRSLVDGENVKASIDACVGENYLIKIELGPQGGKAAVRVVQPLPNM